MSEFYDISYDRINKTRRRQGLAGQAGYGGAAMWEKKEPNHSRDELEDLAEAVFQEMLEAEEEESYPQAVEYWVHRLRTEDAEQYNTSDLRIIAECVWEKFHIYGIELFRVGPEPGEKLYGIGPHTDLTFDYDASAMRCPGCGSSDTARIIYGRGMPTEQELQAWPGCGLLADWKRKAEAGRIVFRKGKLKKALYAGRKVRISPGRICNQCRKRFRNSSLMISEDGTVVGDCREMVKEIRFSIGGFHQGYKEIVITKAENGAWVGQRDTLKEEDAGPEKIGPVKWKSLMDRLYGRVDLQDWNAEYFNPDILDGEQWELTIRMANGKTFEYSGSNKYPPAMLDFICVLRDCAGFRFRLNRGVRDRLNGC